MAALPTAGTSRLTARASTALRRSDCHGGTASRAALLRCRLPRRRSKRLRRAALLTSASAHRLASRRYRRRAPHAPLAALLRFARLAPAASTASKPPPLRRLFVVRRVQVSARNKRSTRGKRKAASAPAASMPLASVVRRKVPARAIAPYQRHTGRYLRSRTRSVSNDADNDASKVRLGYPLRQTQGFGLGVGAHNQPY
jgi:hypothetical protein